MQRVGKHWKTIQKTRKYTTVGKHSNIQTVGKHSNLIILVLVQASTTSTTPRPPPPMAELEAEQKRRLASLKETCAKYNIGEGHHVGNGEESVEVEEMTSWLMRQSVPKKPLWQNLICSKKHNISICPVYKAASTFLLKKFLLIAPSKSYDKWDNTLFSPKVFTFLRAGSR